MPKRNDIIKKDLYPKVDAKIKQNKNKYKQCLSRFINSRSKDLYDIAPFERLYFRADDLEDFYKSTGLNEREIRDIISNTYYYNIANFNPRAAKDEYTIAMMCIIRHFYLARARQDLEISCIYLAFSGRFYTSIHSGCFPTVAPSQYRYVMEYVINYKLSNKYDIKREGNLFGAIKSICNTWINTYEDKLKNFEDDDVVYMVQQLHDRIKAFMINIATEYYKAYDDKEYLTYESDAAGEDGEYRIADNDSLKIENVIEKTMGVINKNNVDYVTCKMAADSNVRTEEVKSIIETILSDPKNLPEVKELIRLTVSLYFANSKTKDVRDIDFITYSIKVKPNTKDPHVLRQKEIIENWLDESSPAYRKRKSRRATKSSYQKSVLYYFVLIIHNANR